MRSAVLVTWAVGLLLAGGTRLSAAPPTHEERARKELERLQGTWKLLSVVVNGRPVRPNPDEDHTAVIKGDTMTMSKGTKSLIALEPPSTEPGPGEIQLVVTAGPEVGRVVKGAYQLTDHFFTVCTAAAQPDVDVQFKRYDTNADGLLNTDEMPEALRLELLKWDRNGDGFIDLEEFRAFVRARKNQAMHDMKSLPGSGVTVLVYARQAPARPQPARPTSSPRWEYQIHNHEQLGQLGKTDLNAGLNKLGEEGWELVAIRPDQRAAGPDTTTEYYFKRPAARTASAIEPGQAEKVLTLQHVNAPDAARILDELMNGNGGKRVRIVADPVTNKLLVTGSLDDLASITVIMERVDVPAEKK